MTLTNTRSLYQLIDMQNQALCPYHDTLLNVCNASLSFIVIDGTRHASYCSSDNFDNCALFLSKTLRKK